MPIYTLQGPDGRTYEIEGPAGATADQLGAVISQSQPKPQANTLSNIIGGAIKGASNIGATLLTPIDAAARAAGIENEWIGRKDRRQAVDEFMRNQGLDTEGLAYGAGKIGTEIAGTAGAGGLIGKAVGAAAPYIPGAARVAEAISSAGFNIGESAKATTAAGRLADALRNTALRVGGGAVTGGASSGLIDPELAKSGAMIGGTVGAAAPAIGKVLSGAVKKLSPRTQTEMAAASFQADDAVKAAANDLGVLPSEFSPQQVQTIREAAVNAFKQGKKLDAAALLRNQDFQNLGIKPLQSQITRDPTAFAQERNLRGVSPEIAQRLQEQNTALQGLFAKPAQSAEEAYQAGGKLSQALSDIDAAARKNVSSLYKEARQSAGKDLEIPLQGLAQDYANTLRDFGDKIPSGVRNNFESLGLLTGKQNKLFTVEEADRLLKVINDNVSNDPAVNAGLSRLRDSVKNSVLQVDEAGGVFAPAVKAAKERFRALEQNPALAAVAEGRAVPDDFVKRYIVQGKTNEVKALASALRSQGDEAFNQAKSQVAEDIRRAAFGENVVGDAAIRPEMLAKKLRELGTEKMKSFFTPQEIDNYQTALRVASYIEKHPNAAPVNTSNTLVAQLMQGPLSKALNAIPGGGIAVNAAKAATGAVKNQMAVSKAVNAKVPIEKLDLSKSQRELLAKVIGSGASSITPQLAQ